MDTATTSHQTPCYGVSHKQLLHPFDKMSQCNDWTIFSLKRKAFWEWMRHCWLTLILYKRCWLVRPQDRWPVTMYQCNCTTPISGHTILHTTMFWLNSSIMYVGMHFNKNVINVIKSWIFASLGVSANEGKRTLDITNHVLKHDFRNLHCFPYCLC